MTKMKKSKKDYNLKRRSMNVDRRGNEKENKGIASGYKRDGYFS